MAPYGVMYQSPQELLLHHMAHQKLRGAFWNSGSTVILGNRGLLPASQSQPFPRGRGLTLWQNFHNTPTLPSICKNGSECSCCNGNCSVSSTFTNNTAQVFARIFNLTTASCCNYVGAKNLLCGDNFGLQFTVYCIYIVVTALTLFFFFLLNPAALI